MGATAAMAVKTDRNDARAIAHAMRVGWFTAVHVKTAESQELRLLLSNRRTLLEKRVAIDNEIRIRVTLKAFGLKLGAVTVAAFEARVLELLAKRSRLLAMVKPMLVARAARQQCEVLHRMVLKAVRTSVVCRRLLSVPGVGPIIALTYATGVDDPARFAHAEISVRILVSRRANMRPVRSTATDRSPRPAMERYARPSFRLR